MTKFITIFFIGLCVNDCWGQTAAEREIDSLNDLCFELFNIDPKRSLKLAERTYTMANKIDYAFGKSSALAYAARCYYVNYSDYDTAFVLYNRAIKIDSLDGHMDDVLVDYAGLASMYRTKGDFERAISYNFQAVRLAKENDYPIYEYGVLFNIANVYSEILDSVNAELTYLEALKVLDGTEDDEMTRARIYGALASTYLNFPGLVDPNAEDKTYEYLMYSKKIAKKHDDIYAESEADAFLCKYHFLQKEYHKALGYGIKSVEAAQAMERPFEEAVNGLLVVEVYIELGQIDKAFEVATISLKLCKENGFDRVRIEGLTFMAKLYMLKGDIDTAYEMFEKRFALNDSIIGLETQTKVKEIALNHHLIEEQNKSLRLENEVLERKSNERRITYLAIGLGVLLVAIIVIVFFVLRLRKAKRELFQSEIEQKAVQDQLEISALEIALLSAQMKPHFTFNVLNSIQYLIVSNQSDKAIKYLSEFSKFLRRTLEYSNQPVITLKEEIAIVESYLSLEQLRFKEKLTYALNIDDKVSLDELQVPSLFLQPFVENSILHGFNHDGSGHILIDISAISSNCVEILIQDNGIKAKQLKEAAPVEKKSMGIDLTRKRLASLDSRNSVEMYDNVGTNGVSVKIIINHSN